MIHIAILIPTIDEIGGAERQVLLLGKELAARSWKVTIIALSGSGQPASAELQKARVSFVSLAMRKGWVDPQGWIRYRTWIANNQPDIVHAHLPHATWFARWARLLTPVRVLVDTIHTSKTSSKSGGSGRRLGYRHSSWLTNHVTCVSAPVARAATSSRMAHHRKLTIVPNGVILPKLENQHIRNLIDTPPPTKASSAFKWIAVGRLAPVKDYSTLFRAFAALQGRPHLLIVGSGPEEQTLHKLAAALGVTDRIQFAGFHRDVQPLLATADGFVLSSLWEGLPVSVLEAAAAGLPVVTTDGAGTRDALIPDTTALVVPVADAAALTNAMTQLMSMPLEKRIEMGAHGRQFVAQNFDLALVVNQWESLYTQLLLEHPTPSRRG